MGGGEPFKHKHVKGETDPHKIKVEYDRIKAEVESDRQKTIREMGR